MCSTATDNTDGDLHYQNNHEQPRTMKLIGKPSINPIVFYSGKIAGYAVWIVLLIQLLNISGFGQLSAGETSALLLIFISLVFIIASLVHLGSSTRLGLPEERTEFKTKGVYKLSRNPMYLGFDLLTFSAILFSNSFIILSLGIYSILSYHLIILSEEKFLQDRFGDQYLKYKSTVRRYI